MGHDYLYDILHLRKDTEAIRCGYQEIVKLLKNPKIGERLKRYKANK
jgi:hypothetical protein